jgi:hypothetical protein
MTTCEDSTSRSLTVIQNPLSALSNIREWNNLLVQTHSNNQYRLYQQFSDNKKIEMDLFDLEGRLLKKYTSEPGKVLDQVIDLGSYSKGIYFLNVYHESAYKVLKLTVN